MDYSFNTAEITEQFCENKAETSLHCDGQCYLMKKLKEHEEQSNSPGSTDQKSDKKHSSDKKLKEYELKNSFEFGMALEESIISLPTDHQQFKLLNTHLSILIPPPKA